MAESNERRVTDGGRDLLAFIRKQKSNIPKFCEEHGLDRVQIQRVINGERWQRISVDLADRIEKATAGKVKMRRFLSRTATVPEDATDDVANDRRTVRKVTRSAARTGSAA